MRPHPSGFSVLAGRSGDAGLATLEGGTLAALLRALPGDEVVLDLGTGLGPQQCRLAAEADLLLVVATKEPTSLTDAYAVLKLHRRDRPGGAARLVVNQASDRAAGERTWRTLDQACSRFLGAGVALAGIVHRDPRVADSIRRQMPLLTRHPGCPAARDIALLATSLAD